MAQNRKQCVYHLGAKKFVPSWFNPKSPQFHNCSVCTPDETGNGFCSRFQPVTIFIVEVKERERQEALQAAGA